METVDCDFAFISAPQDDITKERKTAAETGH